jgi:predicted metal-dependent phosphoesterase TrpH
MVNRRVPEPGGIDLHAHSSISDGTEPPAGLVAAAVAANLSAVAITDHDTLAGWPEARKAAARTGIRLIPGLELSCQVGPVSVHLLAYWLDPDDQVLQDELAKIRTGRGGRLPAMLAGLAAAGVDITEAQVATAAGTAVSLGRPHVADAMVTAGYVADRQEAFDRYLREGKPGYVSRYSPELRHAIALVRSAGGVPVIAHPWGRSSKPVLTRALLSDLARSGLAGLEARHLDHDRAAEAELTKLAGDLGLLVTGGSDWHGVGKVDHPLGARTTDSRVLAELAGQARNPA